MLQWIVSSSVLILVMIGLRFLLRGRVKPGVQYALWALVLVVGVAVACVFTGSKPGDTDTPDSTESTDSTDSTDSTESTENNGGTNQPEVVVVLHKEGATYDLPGKTVDTSIMKDGYLYAIDSQTTRQLSQEKVDNWYDLSDCVLYVTQAEPYVVRCAWVKQVNDEIFLKLGKGLGEGTKIKAMQYVQGKLMMAVQEQNKYCESTSIAVCIPDAPTQGSVTIGPFLMTVHRIESFTYADSSTAFPDVKTHISTEDMGATIRWKGQRYGGETGVHEYYYFVESGEYWYADTFEKVPDPAPAPFGVLIVPGVINDTVVGQELPECTPGHLYYWDEIKDKAHLVADEKVICCTMAYGKAFFVKAAEPTKLYVAQLNDLRNHRVVYESDFGPITKVSLNSYMVHFTNETLLLIEKDKRLTVLDFTENTATPIVEMHYMSYAAFYPGESKYTSWRDVPSVYLKGQLSPEEQESEYYYHIETGEMKDSAHS